MLARLCLLGCLALGQATDPTELGASSFPSAGGNSFVSFESVGVAGTSVADHYRATKGCVFSNTSAQASEWARNGSFVAANAPVGGWGDKPMSFRYASGRDLPAKPAPTEWPTGANYCYCPSQFRRAQFPCPGDRDARGLFRDWHVSFCDH
jgi:hypothetical protein